MKECTLEDFTGWLREIQEQPAWRGRADKEMDYVDGNQLDSVVLAAQREKGIPPAIEPLIGPVIDSLVGIEALNRRDWLVGSDKRDEEGEEVAEAFGHKLNQAERMSKADLACSDAYKTQISVGVGWVEVSRDPDPFKYPYRCIPVHRNEIWWDFLAKQKDLSDARYLIRRKWLGVDQAVLMFPKKEKVIRGAVSNWEGVDTMSSFLIDGGTSTDLSMGVERGWSIEEQEWRDTRNNRACLFEVWYRVWESALVLKMRDGRILEYDKKNPLHLQAAAIGVPLVDAVISKVRLAWFLGPHRLEDGPSPYKHGRFQYIPFWGKREDRTGVPYGLVRGMMYLQDEINARSSKMQWMLSATRTIRTEGAVLDDDETFRQMSGRSDADFVLDAAEMAKQGARFEIVDNIELSQQQYDRLIDARESLKRVSRIAEAYSTNKGPATPGDLNRIAESSVQGLPDLNDNFAQGRSEVGDVLLSLLIEDAAEEEEVMVPGTALNKPKVITLNKPVEENGIQYLTNDTQRTKLKVTLSEVPSTPSYKAQQLSSLSEVLKTMTEKYQELAYPHLIDLTNTPNKKELAEAIRNMREQPTEEDIEKRIDEAVKAALVKAQVEQKDRELDIKEKLTEAQIEKLIAEKVNKAIESIYSATQAGGQIAAMPGIAPIGDQILKSAGFVDSDLPPIINQPNLTMPPVASGMPIGDTETMPDVQKNTSPMFPPRVQEPDLAPPLESQINGAEMPENGMEGIEQAGIQI